jgi:capsular exopolysaccharide synthesis family protein
VALGTAATRDIKYGFAGGLLLAFCVAFLLEYVDRNIKTPEQIKNDLSLPFLGLVPLVSGKHQENRLVSDAPAATFGEAFRTLRTNVKLSIATDGARTVLVTSACPGDGKTLVASNLAVVLAMTDQKVILIDADLRRPRLHKVFNYPSEPGLSDLLVGDAQSTEIRTTSVPGLHLLTCGSLPPNPSELLDSRRFRHLIEKLGRKYDWIIIDSPPVLPVTDAIILGETAAAVVLVVAAEQTPMYSARAALEQLENARAHVIGAVLNRADLKRRAYYYERYYRHEYGQYYTESTSPA